jgi:hypothetical protein
VVTAAETAIVIAGGYIYNKGTLIGKVGIASGGSPGSYVYNTGFVSASTGDGVSLSAAGSMSNTGHIVASAFGIVLGGGGIAYNSGNISAGIDGILSAGGAVYNYKTGTITGAPYGVLLSQAGHVFNGGSIAGEGGPTGEMGGAVVLNDGGSVYNAAGGRLFGISGIVATGAPLTATNAGQIYALGYTSSAGNAAGIYAGDGGTITNTGTIQGSERSDLGVNGILVTGAAGTVANHGLISGHFYSAAVVLRDGGMVLNSGTIDNFSGYNLGIAMTNGGSIVNSGYVAEIYMKGPASITNSGTIGGLATLLNGGMVTNTKQMYGVTFAAAGMLSNSGNMLTAVLAAGGTVINTGALGGGYQNLIMAAGGYVLNEGFISGFRGAAVYAGPSGTVVNDGMIQAPHGFGFGFNPTGIVSTGATLINNGVVYGFLNGIRMTHGGTIYQNGKVDAGSSTSVAVYFKSGYDNRLVIAPGASFIGTVKGGGGVLELAAAKSVGAIDLGNSLTGFSNIVIDPDASWTFDEPATLAATLPLDNRGTLIAPTGPRLTIASTITGNGTIAFGAAGLAVDGGVAAGQHIAFGGTAETLDIGSAASFAGTIENFAAGDTIDLTGIAKNLVDNIAFSHGVLTINEAFAAYNITFANPASFAGDKFKIFKDRNGTGITLQSAAKMAFLSPPQPVSPPMPALISNAALPAAQMPIAAPMTIIAATGGWAPRWPEPATLALPSVTLHS